MKMKAVVCVFLLVLTLVSRASTETDCTEVDPGSSADVCSMLQEKLQSALLQNPTNLDKLRKAFANPIPSIIDIHYDIEWGNVTAEACTDESTNFSLTSHYSSNYLWTNVKFFTTLSPGFLQHLQLQVPYAMIRFAELFFGRVRNDYNLNAIVWDGCSDELLLSLSLSLRVDSLPCTPSKQLLESSIQELTSWLQVFADVWPQTAFTLDIGKKQYAILHQPPLKFSESAWKIITGFTLAAVVTIYLFIVGSLLHTVKQRFLEKNRDRDEELPYPLIGILVWNVLVLAGELYAIITTCYIGLLSFSLKITLFVIPIVYLLIRVCRCITENRKKKNLTTVAVTNFLIQGNLFLFIEYFTASVVPASLLVYTYPIQVIATIALLSTGLVFCIFLAMFSRILYKQALTVCQNRIKQKKTESFFYLFRWLLILLFSTLTIASGILLIVTLLAIFDIAILKGEANLSGPYGLVLAFLPTAVFSVLSWLMHKYKVKGLNSKQAEKENATAMSALEEGRDKSDMTDHQPTARAEDNMSGTRQVNSSMKTAPHYLDNITTPV